ncbi:MAG: putative alpha/beta hydrolase superfamily protein [Firmicutes bacterium]|nr:putative alpha/beta hydrolase superfamily protein [Bacillota bacterium]
MILGEFAKDVMLAIIVICIVIVGVSIMLGPKSPPVMSSIDSTAKSLDYRGLPTVSYFTARDNTQLAYRVYRGSPDKVAILVHGSSGSSVSMHALGKVLSNNGITVFALDVRGHGDSGSRGDINYVGQLEDDLADFVNFIRADYPAAPITLIGHSSGGGFALRIAGSQLNDLFSQYILLSPYLNYDSPTVRPANKDWANASVPRVVGISILNRLGIHYFDSIPVVAFAVPEDVSILTKTYSYRLWNNYKANDNYLEDFRKTSAPITIIVGADDEQLYPEQFAPLVQPVNDKVTVQIVPNTNHMAIVSKGDALKTIIQHF